MEKKNSKRYLKSRLGDFFSNKEKQLTPKKPKLPPVKILSKWVIGFGALLIIAWSIYFLSFFYKEKYNKKISITSLNLVWTWENSFGIISTPVLSKIEGEKDYGVVLADLSGNLVAIKMYNPNQVFSFELNDRIISPLSKVNLTETDEKNILIIKESGGYVVLDKRGNFIYESRDGLIDEPIQNKPLFIEDTAKISRKEANLFLLSKFGKAWGINSTYGQAIWENHSLPLKGNTILASPIFIDEKIFAISEQGKAVLLNPKNGFLIWNLDLKSGAKASPLVFPAFYLENQSNHGHQENIFILGIKGDFYLVSEQGQVLTKGNVKDNFVSTPNLIELRTQIGNKKISKKKSIVAASTTGNVYLFLLNKENQFEVEKIFPKEIFSKELGANSQNQGQINEYGDEFISSPVVADFNLDEIEDVLLVSRNGRVILIDGETLDFMTEPFYLFKQNNSPRSLANQTLVSASPLMADLNGDGNLEIVIASEDGKIFFLSILTNPENAFEKNVILQGEFLKNSLNRNNS